MLSPEAARSRLINARVRTRDSLGVVFLSCPVCVVCLFVLFVCGLLFSLCEETGTFCFVSSFCSCSVFSFVGAISFPFDFCFLVATVVWCATSHGSHIFSCVSRGGP
jgi:hypothetical protein